MEGRTTVGRPRRHGEDTHEAIKAVARRHMAEQGTASISLRAIARDLDMTAPALYRYFPRLDNLITALILDAFNALGDAMERASRSLPHDQYGERLMAALLAYRQWALEHPTDFQLIYGNPIPGYHAPAEQTIPAAARAGVVIVDILAAAVVAGQLHIAADYREGHIPPPVLDYLKQMGGWGTHVVPPEVLYVTNIGWSRMHGVIMLEMFGHFAPVVGDVDAFYRCEMQRLIESMGLTVTD